MNYKVNSDFVKKVIEIKDSSTGFMEDMGELQAFINENITTDELMEQFLLSGFMSMLEDAAKYQGVELDLTYDTAQNIRDALVGIVATHASVYEMETNAMLIIYCVSAYLSLLAINNHDVGVVINKKEGTADEWENEETWQYTFSLNLVSKNAERDLLQEAIDGLDDPLIVGNELFINLENVISAYKDVTGVDLDFYDLTNIAIVFKGLEEGTENLLS